MRSIVMRIIKRYFDIRTQQNESLSKLVEALKENNKSLRELIQIMARNANQLNNDMLLLLETEKDFISKMEATLRMQTTIESEKLKLTQRVYEESQPTEDDARY